ncbi:MAG TPA: hypothetical protein VGI10_22980 [Polyangiaceae bacterium]
MAKQTVASAGSVGGAGTAAVLSGEAALDVGDPGSLAGDGAVAATTGAAGCEFGLAHATPSAASEKPINQGRR